MAAADLTGLLNFGAIGCVLAWMLWRSDSRQERIERALDRLTRGQMLTLISRPDVDDHVKQQARAILRELSPGQDNEMGV